MIAFQDVVGEAAQSSEDARIFSDSRCVFTERNIARVVRSVLDRPVLANRGSGGLGCDGAVGQIERNFEAGFPSSCGGLEVEYGPLDPDDGGHVQLPFRFGDRRLGIEHCDGSGFVAVAPVPVDGRFAR